MEEGGKEGREERIFRVVKVSLLPLSPVVSLVPFTIQTKPSELFLHDCLKRRFPLGLELGLSLGTDNLLAWLLGQGLATYLT